MVDTVFTTVTLVIGSPDIFKPNVFSASIFDELKPIPEAKWVYGQLFNDIKTLIKEGRDELSN